MIVVKIGGSVRHLDPLLEDIAATTERVVVVHGALHLAGHDHLFPSERTVMEAEERRLAAAVGMPWPYLEGTPG